MDKKYIDLFKTLAQATAATAEQVMDYDRSKNDQKGLETSTIMRDDYQDLADRIDVEGYVPTKNDIAKFWVAATIQTQQLQDRIDNLKKAMVAYQTDLLPKLDEIVERARDDEDAANLANEKFILENNK